MTQPEKRLTRWPACWAWATPVVPPFRPRQRRGILIASPCPKVADVLVERTTRCALDQGLKTLVLVGGVAANRRLRQRLEERCQVLKLQWRAAPLAYCTDNAAMIAVAAEQRFCAGRSSSIRLAVTPRLPLEQAPVLYEPQAAF